MWAGDDSCQLYNAVLCIRFKSCLLRKKTNAQTNLNDADSPRDCGKAVVSNVIMPCRHSVSYWYAEIPRRGMAGAGLCVAPPPMAICSTISWKTTPCALLPARSHSSHSFTTWATVLPLKPQFYQPSHSFTSRATVLPLEPQFYHSSHSFTTRVGV